MILVTAANGNQGKLLCPKLIEAGLKVRALVRSEDSAAKLRELGVHEVIVGDMADPAVLERAMNGVEKVYHNGPTAHPHERAMGLAAIDAARANGVNHFVFSSVLHAIVTDLVQHEIKRDIEEYLVSSGLEYTILQPSNYMSPIKLRPVFKEGVFRLSWSLDRLQSMVDLEDVTEVAAMVLSDSESHAAATYELVAPGRYTAWDIGNIISSVLERPIEVEQIDADRFLAEFFGEGGADKYPHEARVLRAISGYYSGHDFVGNANVLRWLLGREPTTYEQFVRRQYAIFQADGLVFSSSR